MEDLEALYLQVLADPRDGAWYCALRMGHFGVKMRKSLDGGASWLDIARKLKGTYDSLLGK